MNINQKEEFFYLYAGLAMTGILANYFTHRTRPNEMLEPTTNELVSKAAVSFAKSLIQEIEKGDNQ